MRIDEIKERVSKATEGPWIAGEDDFYITVGRKIVALAQNVNVPIKQIEANQHFIAHAREDVPCLLSELEKKDALINDQATHAAQLLSELASAQERCKEWQDVAVKQDEYINYLMTTFNKGGTRPVFHESLAGEGRG